MNLIHDHRLHRPQRLPRLAVSSRYRLSGVVIRMSPGCFRNRARSFCGVSPVRTLISGIRTATPSRCAIFAMPTSGDRRFRSTSAASAFSGDRYTTRQPCSASSRRPQHQLVQAPQKRRQRLARPRRRQNQRRLPPRNRRPTLHLRSRRPFKHRPKPLRRNRMKQLQNISPGSARPQRSPLPQPSPTPSVPAPAAPCSPSLPSLSPSRLSLNATHPPSHSAPKPVSTISLKLIFVITTKRLSF